MMNEFMPRHLNWKCLDNFDKVPNRKIFLVGEMEITPFQRAKLNKIFAELKEKWKNKIINLLRKEEKTHLEIAGGNYTFFFVLPQAIKWIRNKHPFLPVSLTIFERGGDIELSYNSPDVLLTGELKDEPDEEQKRKAKEFKYIVSRKCYYDSMFLGASKDAVAMFGSKENTLKYHDVLFDRQYAIKDIEKVPLRSATPSGRENIRPKVVVDQYFLQYMLMLNSAGIGDLFSSFHHSDNLVRLDEKAVEVFKRFVIYKQSLKEYKWVATRLIRSLESHGG